MRDDIFQRLEDMDYNFLRIGDHHKNERIALNLGVSFSTKSKTT